jgi:hypothetical protein
MNAVAARVREAASVDTGRDVMSWYGRRGPLSREAVPIRDVAGAGASRPQVVEDG